MGIYENDYHDLRYYRVYRSWGGKEYQEYVRIRRSEKAAYKKALAIDNRLAKCQKAYYLAEVLSPNYHIRPDGRIRGLRRITVNRKDRPSTEVFHLRISVPQKDKVDMTTISITVNGVDKAFERSIHKIAEWHGLSKDSDVFKAMKMARPVYEE